MKNKLTILLFLISINCTFSQEKIKADIDIINFLGRIPQKTERHKAILLQRVVVIISCADVRHSRPIIKTVKAIKNV
jgi:hypothetical protein